MKPKITVIGSGSWGTTIAHLIALNNNQVNIYSRNKKQAEEINNNHTNEKYLPKFKLSKNIKATTSLKESVEDINIIFIAVPSKNFRKIIKKILL